MVSRSAQDAELGKGLHSPGAALGEGKRNYLAVWEPPSGCCQELLAHTQLASQGLAAPLFMCRMLITVQGPKACFKVGQFRAGQTSRLPVPGLGGVE